MASAPPPVQQAQYPPAAGYPPPQQAQYPPPGGYPPPQQAQYPPPQQAQYPPPAGYPPPQQVAPPGGGGNRSGIIVLGVIAAIALVAAGVWFITKEDGDGSSANGGQAVAASATVATDVGGVVETESGVRVEVPSAAVPLNAENEQGEISFSIEEFDDVADTGVPVSGVPLPDGVSVGDTIYRFGPEGQTFTGPVIVEIPIADGVDIATVGGVATLKVDDSGQWSWVPLPSSIDTERRVVRAETTHFSLFGPWYANDAYRQWERENGGWLEVTNLNTWGAFPNGFFGYDPPHFQTTATTYGFCIQGYTLDDPDAQIPWYVQDDWMITKLAHPGADFILPSDGTNSQWLPAGTYQMTEVWYGGEINRGEIFYLPLYGWATRSNPVTVRIDRGGTVSYAEESRVDLDDGTWTVGRPTCAGAAMPALGTGDVQITLNWPQTNVDLDLHVIDPSGEEIYYAHDTSASGGWLDWDNTYGGNQPENVYWGTAPSGEYQVSVVYFSGEPTANWTIRTVVNGRTENFSGSISPDDDRAQVTTFRVG